MIPDTNETLTVMTLNLRFGLADDGQNSWDSRREAYPELFRQYSPDFIGIQEANDFQTDYLAELLKRHHYIGRRDDTPRSWQDNVIFYDEAWTCLKKKLYFLSDTPEVESRLDDSVWPRQCIIGLFEKKKRKLIHVNTHFDFKATVQEKSAALILDFLKDFPQDVTTLITGDFNTSPSSETYDIFRRNGFRDLFDRRHSSTFHGFTGKDLGGHIDWILFKGPLRGGGHMIVREPFSGRYPSDHYPVLSVFEWET
ncbi:endonuclease/exonuclease/phosphatase family protein [Desulfatiferula olefinivorans]